MKKGEDDALHVLAKLVSNLGMQFSPCNNVDTKVIRMIGISYKVLGICKPFKLINLNSYICLVNFKQANYFVEMS